MSELRDATPDELWKELELRYGQKGMLGMCALISNHDDSERARGNPFWYITSEIAEATT